MIFVAVGTQFPFDRLTRAVDEWAVTRNREDVYGQIGPTTFQPKAIHAETYLSPEVFADYSRRASLLVAHAGMGLIITALEMGKPIIIMPRRASLGEHRNEHQLATVKRFSDRKGIYVAAEVEDLVTLLDGYQGLYAGDTIANAASPELLGALRDFIART